MTNSDKIISLQAYIQKLNSQRSNIPARRLPQKEAYLSFIDTEVRKTTAKIKQLKGE